MSDVVIHTESLGKNYVIDEGRDAPGTGTLFGSLLRGRRGTRSVVHALKDVSIDVHRGEIVGLVGGNGAGKSTLLKLLSRITCPSAGSAVVRGRVGALLEVGTGFHHELTGRENIFLNGAVLGMTRTDIRGCFDSIVHFADIGQYLDTPVKRYSSGMFMRLAFAVAAHLRTEILLVDEVLAVGDAEFQRRCLAKMEDVAGSGRTVLFVSHNLGAVRELCTRGLHIAGGRVVCDAGVEEAVDHYLEGFSDTPAEFTAEALDPAKVMQITTVRVCRADGAPAARFLLGEPILLHLRTHAARPVTDVHVAIQVKRNGVPVFTSFDIDEQPELLTMRPAGEGGYAIVLPVEALKAGFYSVNVDCGVMHRATIDMHRDVVTFTIDESQENTMHRSHASRRPGVVRLPVHWQEMGRSMEETS